MKAVQHIADKYTASVAWTGSLFGWISFDLLRASQIFAALAAGMVSICALILTAPKAWAEVQRWHANWRARK